MRSSGAHACDADVWYVQLCELVSPLDRLIITLTQAYKASTHHYNMTTRHAMHLTARVFSLLLVRSESECHFLPIIALRCVSLVRSLATLLCFRSHKQLDVPLLSPLTSIKTLSLCLCWRSSIFWSDYSRTHASSSLLVSRRAWQSVELKKLIALPFLCFLRINRQFYSALDWNVLDLLLWYHWIISTLQNFWTKVRFLVIIIYVKPSFCFRTCNF